MSHPVSKANRRGFLVAATATVVVPSIAAWSSVKALAVQSVVSSPEESLERLGKQIQDAHSAADAAGQGLERAETAMFDWSKRNPRPKMREHTVGTGAEYEAYTKQLFEADDPSDVTLQDPNGDLKAAMKQHEAAIITWAVRKKTAEANCGIDDARAATEKAGDHLQSLIETMGETPARSFRGLAIKARVADLIGEVELKSSIVDDILDAEDEGNQNATPSIGSFELPPPRELVVSSSAHDESLPPAGADAELHRLGAYLEAKMLAAVEKMQRHDSADDALSRGEISQAEYEAADSAYDEALGDLDTAWKQIKKIRANTIEGLRIKARLWQFHRLRNGNDLVDVDDWNYEEDPIGVNLIKDLVAGDPKPLAMPATRG